MSKIRNGRSNPRMIHGNVGPHINCPPGQYWQNGQCVDIYQNISPFSGRQWCQNDNPPCPDGYDTYGGDTWGYTGQCCTEPASPIQDTACNYPDWGGAGGQMTCRDGCCYYSTEEGRGRTRNPNSPIRPRPGRIPRPRPLPPTELPTPLPQCNFVGSGYYAGESYGRHTFPGYDGTAVWVTGQSCTNNSQCCQPNAMLPNGTCAECPLEDPGGSGGYPGWPETEGTNWLGQGSCFDNPNYDPDAGLMNCCVYHESECYI